MRRVALDVFDAALKKPFGVDRGGRPPGAVEGHDVIAAAGRIEAEAVAADTCRGRLDNGLHGAGRKRGVKGVAAVLEDSQRGLG